MDRRIFVLIVLFLVLTLAVNCAFIIFFGIEVNKKNQLNEKKIDEKIEKVVLSTVTKIREDVGILTPSNKNSDKSQEEKSKKIKIEGADIKTLGNEFYIENRHFRLGDVLFPYGIAIEVARDCVVFSDFDGQITVVCQPGRKSGVDTKEDDPRETEDKPA